MHSLRKRLRPAVLFVMFGLILVGCAQGVAEFQLYVQAFNSQYQQGQIVLDRVARAERIVVRRRLPSAANTTNFRPDDAAYYVDSGDPPLTGSIRLSLQSLYDYNNALGALANGERAEALAARMGTLTTTLLSTAVSIGQATGVVALVPLAGEPLEKATNAVNRAVPIVKTVGTYASREAFRIQLIKAYPAMHQLMSALREATPAMYEIMRRSYVERGSLETGTGISQSNESVLEKDRELLAGWAMLLDKSSDTMEVAVASAMSRASAGDLTMLTTASLELQVLAKQIQDLRKKP